MKTKIIFAIFLFIPVFALISCNKETERPEILHFELGYNNSKRVIRGQGLHIDADIIAINRIERVIVKIHPEDSHNNVFLPTKSAVKWEVDTIYMKFLGLRNTTFHEDLDVPLDAGLGHYHFYFSVVDMKGNTTMVEDKFEVLDAAPL